MFVFDGILLVGLPDLGTSIERSALSFLVAQSSERLAGVVCFLTDFLNFVLGPPRKVFKRLRKNGLQYRKIWDKGLSNTLMLHCLTQRETMRFNTFL